MRQQMHVRVVPMTADHLDEIVHSKLPGIPGTDDCYLHGSFHLRKPDSGKDCITFLIR